MSTVMEKKVPLTTETMIKYLNLYVGEIDWRPKLDHLYEILCAKMSKEEAKEKFKQSVAFAILGQEYTGVSIPDSNMATVLHRTSFSQFKEKSPEEWVQLLETRLLEDAEIQRHRDTCLSLGIVYPLEYSPVTRQAYNWLYGKAEEAGAITDSNKKDMIRRFQNLVYAYGGNVICYIFMKEENKMRKKILNWRSNYFFERLIFDVYTPEQIIKIKKQELNKTNSKLVKKVRAD